MEMLVEGEARACLLTRGGPHGPGSLRNNKLQDLLLGIDSTEIIMGGSKDLIPRILPQ